MAFYKEIAESNPEYLIAYPLGAERIGISVAPGQGIIKRGTVVYQQANGLFAPAGSAQIVGTNYIAVLDETVDTNENASVAAAVRAYIKGRLFAKYIILANNDTLTAANELVLRQQGITLDEIVGDRVFENGYPTITYKANNGTTEADYVDHKTLGSAYTILGNTVTGFTPPSTKSFSKWNTAADGSGTEYAAAASYATDSALTLYAIYA